MAMLWAGQQSMTVEVVGMTRKAGRVVVAMMTVQTLVQGLAQFVERTLYVSTSAPPTWTLSRVTRRQRTYTRQAPVRTEKSAS